MNYLLRTLIFLHLLNFWVSGVEAQVVKCRICNSKTGAGVAYASIITQNANRGCSADSLGYFFASLTDSIRVTAIGYAPLKITIASLTPDANELRVGYLSELSLCMNELTITGRKTGKYDTFKIKSYSKSDEKGTRYNAAGIQFAVKMENKLSKAGFVDWVSFKFSRDGGQTPEATLRLRIYRVNSQNINLPGEDVLLENVVVKPRNGWVTIDLRRYNIPFPTSGIFVGLEWLESNVVTPKGGRVNPGVHYALNSSCAYSVECYRQNGWKPDTSFEQIGQACMMLKMKVSVKQ